MRKTGQTTDRRKSARGKDRNSFTPAEDAEALANSIKVIVRLILKTKGIHETHRRLFLDRCLWQLTQVKRSRKYDLKFASKSASEQIEGGNRKGLRHEQVYPRRRMVDELLKANGGQVDAILEKACGCVVTQQEHNLLSKFDSLANGWDRYRRARIDVIDRETGERVSWKSLHSKTSA